MNALRVRRSILGLGLTAILLAAPLPAAAAAPLVFPFSETFVDINPCTGEPHTIMVTGTFYEFDRANGIAYRIDRLVATSSGLSGSGNEVGIGDRIFKLVDILTSANGDTMRVNATIIRDPAGTVHVESIDLTCRSRP